MPARLQSSSNEIPASLAVASMNSGVSRSSSAVMPQVYLQDCTPVNSSLATRRIHGGCAQAVDVEMHDRKTVKEFLLAAAKHADTDLSGLARLAGLAPSTVTRFVNGDSKYLPTTRTLSKIAEASGYPSPVLGAPQRLHRAGEWLALISQLPPTVENNVFEMLRGLTEAPGSSEQESSPSKRSGRRVRA